MPDEPYDYVIVGSGAGGGTLAARLAENRKRVLLLEAGGDPCEPDSEGLPQNYDVPAFHPFASEDPAISWNYFVDHYADRARGREDTKWRDKHYGRAYGGDGILYPRASALGGCTAHNAMIFVRPDDSDWQGIADLTHDESWAPARMNRYLQLLENCGHRKAWRWLRWLGINPTGHGWGGWLHTERAMPLSVLTDPKLLWTLHKSARAALGHSEDRVEAILRLFQRHLDPNDVRQDFGCGGLCYTPTSTRGFKRMGSRERVLDVQEKHRKYLDVELNALVTRVVLDDNKRAVGVEYLKGARLYAAHTSPSTAPGESRSVRVRGEVILCAGAFNTPQLLMLSGIGDPEVLAKVGIETLVALPGVGKNLQDRYEVGVVNRMCSPWEAMRGATFKKGDAPYNAWLKTRDGLYSSNGIALAFIASSTAGRSPPDLFCMALLSRFEGYFPEYSELVRNNLDHLTWCILKAHTNNRAGEVTLRSKNPRDMPLINFNYFTGEGAEDDLQSVVNGINLVRKLTDRLRRDKVIAEETQPGSQNLSDEELADYVRKNAWGHHASCSCAIGTVLNSKFEVLGTRGLRVVDASVFPRIPGYFIASAVYMIAEKAADAILNR